MVAKLLICGRVLFPPGETGIRSCRPSNPSDTARLSAWGVYAMEANGFLPQRDTEDALTIGKSAHFPPQKMRHRTDCHRLEESIIFFPCWLKACIIIPDRQIAYPLTGAVSRYPAAL